jgi:FtsH-binding integral membrane protein
MSYGYDYPVAAAPAEARAEFIRKTYGHLAGAILAFVGVEYVLLQIPGVGQMSLNMLGNAWFLVLLGFMAVSWVANSWAQSDTSRPLQYMGLSLYVLAEAVLFLPLLYIADTHYPGAIRSAGILTLCVFGGLTAAVFVSRRDYSNMRSYLTVGSFLALGFIGISFFFPMTNMVGLIFCFFMVALASGYIIYYTSNIMLHYRTDQYVAASLALFASVMLLFWYILQIVMSRGND